MLSLAANSAAAAGLGAAGSAVYQQQGAGAEIRRWPALGRRSACRRQPALGRGFGAAGVRCGVGGRRSAQAALSALPALPPPP
eukprot:gene14524-4508_t